MRIPKGQSQLADRVAALINHRRAEGLRCVAGDRRQTAEDADEQQGADSLDGDSKVNGADGGER